MDFPWQKKEEVADNKPSKAKEYWQTAKRKHQGYFEEFLAEANSFDSFEEFAEALVKESWKLTQTLCKESVSNGVATGRRKGRK